MDYHYSLKLEFNAKDYDLVISLLYDLGVQSFEEGQSAIDLEGNYQILNEHSLITIRSEDLTQLEIIKEHLKLSSCDIRFTDLGKSENLLDEWKKFAQPIQITSKIRICPSWISQEVNQDTIILDPAYAFGSGSHETTALCALEIEKLSGSKTLLDVGCGSGILSLIASRLGYLECKGIDIDSLAVEAARENALKNSINNIEFTNEKLNQINKKYDVVVANILSSVLFDLKADLIRALKPGGTLVLSGILNEEVDYTVSEFKPGKYNTYAMEQWAVITANYL